MNNFLPKDQRRTIGEASIDSTTLYNRLKSANIGDIVTYSELSKIIGGDVTNPKLRQFVYTALAMCNKNDNMVFDCVMKVGYKRLNDKEITEKSTTQPFRKIRSTISRANRDIRCINVNNLDNDEFVKLNATRSVFGVLAEITKPKLIKEISDSYPEPLPLLKTIDFFRSQIK
jgi:hypothetical protein